MSLTYTAVVDRLRAAGCVYAEDEASLLLATPGNIGALVDQRVTGRPLEHLLGWVEFCGLRIAVDAGVFVPRQRTTFLVSLAADLAGRIVVDLCCGSGAVGAAIVAVRPGTQLHAVDIDPTAIGCARRNLGERVYEGDLYQPLPTGLRGRVDVLVANAPYVPTGAIGTLPPEARDHEPRIALDGGPDGLDVARRVIAGASGWLRPGGHLLIETSRHQAPKLAQPMATAGLKPRIEADENLDATVVVGCT